MGAQSQHGRDHVAHNLGVERIARKRESRGRKNAASLDTWCHFQQSKVTCAAPEIRDHDPFVAVERALVEISRPDRLVLE